MKALEVLRKITDALVALLFAVLVVLVLILLAAVGYLVAQEYMVYDDEGHRHLELPFLKKGQTEQPQQPEDTTPDDVDLIIDEPEHPLLKELHARQLPDTVLTEDPSAVLAEHPEAVVIPVKLRDGKSPTDMEFSFIEKLALKKALSKIRGTDLEKLLKEYHIL